MVEAVRKLLLRSFWWLAGWGVSAAGRPWRRSPKRNNLDFQ